MSLALRPVHGFPVLPGWTSLHRLLRPVCPICPVASQARLPFAGKDRWFLGSYLVTGLGAGWLPNAFSLTGSLRTGFFVLQALEPSYRSLRFHRQALLDDLQFSWHRRPRMPAATWSRLAFAIDRLTLSNHSERLLFGMWSIPHNSLMFPGS